MRVLKKNTFSCQGRQQHQFEPKDLAKDYYRTRRRDGATSTEMLPPTKYLRILYEAEYRVVRDPRQRKIVLLSLDIFIWLKKNSN